MAMLFYLVGLGLSELSMDQHDEFDLKGSMSTATTELTVTMIYTQAL
jgi:phosphoenolpyruvate-protein kinase (PTS system EI component)